MSARIALLLTSAVALVAGGLWLSRDRHSRPPSDTPAGTFAAHPNSGSVTIWAVGDAASGSAAEESVVALIGAGRPDQLLYLGDVYESGTAAEFEQNYAPQLGVFRTITLPTPGNHDWPRHKQGYDPYWSATTGGARPPDHYSIRTGGWQLISLNSESPHEDGSEQVRWLERKLKGPGDCRIGFWHRPRYSAGSHGDQDDLDPIWSRLAGHSRLVVNGHEHNMQRLRPIEGITTLISGAGGRGHYGLDTGDERWPSRTPGATAPCGWCSAPAGPAGRSWPLMGERSIAAGCDAILAEAAASLISMDSG